jgi:hypothetical protein
MTAIFLSSSSPHSARMMKIRNAAIEITAVMKMSGRARIKYGTTVNKIWVVIFFLPPFWDPRLPSTAKSNGREGSQIGEHLTFVNVLRSHRDCVHREKVTRADLHRIPALCRVENKKPEANRICGQRLRQVAVASRGLVATPELSLI